MKLSHDQEQGTADFLAFLLNPSQSEITLTAPPGRGKTFMTKYMLERAEAISDQLRGYVRRGKLDINVTATTNPAAEVASKMLGRGVSTIHSFLGLTPKLNYKTGKEELKKTKRFKVLPPMIIVVDEAGSVSKELEAYIMEACVHCKVMYVGDDAQTAPVGEDFCPVFDRGLPNIGLTTNHRNKGAIGSLGDEMRLAVYSTGEVIKMEEEIVRLSRAKEVITREMRQDLQVLKDEVYFPPFIANGVDIIAVDGEEFQEMVEHDYQLPNHSESDGKIICWRNDTVGIYNDHIRGLFTDDDVLMVGETVLTNKPITNMGQIMASTDSLVMVTAVHPESMEQGIVGNWLQIDGDYEVFQARDMKAVKNLMQAYYKAREYSEYHIAKELFVDLRPTHSCTVHKSQGRTYKTAYLNLDDIGDCPSPNAVARMLNTGLTRAAERLVIYGILPKKYGGED